MQGLPPTIEIQRSEAGDGHRMEGMQEANLNTGCPVRGRRVPRIRTPSSYLKDF
jgi:hypothetical protein